MLLHKLLRLRYKLGRLNHVHPAAFELIDELMELLLEVDHQFGKIPEDDPKQLYRFMFYVKGSPITEAERNLIEGLLSEPDTECRKETKKPGVHL